MTSNSAVAERPRDASCLSAVSFIITIPRAQSFIYLRQRRRYMISPSHPRSFVCLSVCKITQKRVRRFEWNVACRQMSDMDELINFWARSGSWSGFRNRISFSHSVCTATRSFITSGKSVLGTRRRIRVILSRMHCNVGKISRTGIGRPSKQRGVETPLSEVNALYRVHF